MTDSTLTREQALNLLRKLGTDDSFRSLFETKPAKALHDAGIPAETIVDLEAKCICPGTLQDKSVFLAAADTMDEAALKQAMGMSPPKLRLGS
jgi:putative modified peptide